MTRSRSALALALAFGLHTAPARAEEKAVTMPRVPEGWKVELIAQAPAIVFPTAIVVGPDGTIYLGQDPMDMPGPVNRPIDSIVTLKDGQITTFADKLWSVMGLEWVDDTLYVVHAPFLSALRDTDGDGKADERVDIMTGLGPKVPGFSGLNDHVPSGLRLGMDGFLYIAVGDKGIPKGVGKDGTTITLFGGGVIRIRPDGTGLEVVSTGERNPLSVALTATDEIFTYGNDDDSKKWPNSLTHHIVGGHYGYPYQFLDRPDRCLPITAGQLGGSGTQGLCYNEDGLPARYRANLFFCDWGLQTVERFVIEKAGATFRVKARESFVTKGDLVDFRPFSLAVTPDGAGFYLVDWAFPGWLADGPRTGRLFRLTYEGPDRPTPTPRPVGSDVKSLVAALDHPAHAVRLRAQRALGKNDAAEAARLLFERIENLQTTGPGRLHALWALDVIRARNAVSFDFTRELEFVKFVLNGPDPEFNRQLARYWGIRNGGRIRREGERQSRQHRNLTDPGILMKDRDPAVRREAAISLGRSGSPDDVPALMDALGDADPFVDWSIRRALKALNRCDARRLTAALLDPKRRDSALKLADESWTAEVVEALNAALEKTVDAPTRARLVTILAGLYRKYPEWSGKWFGTNPLAGEFPRKTLDWDARAMDRILGGLAKRLDDSDAKVRAAVIAGLVSVGKPASALLRSRLGLEKDDDNLAAIARGVGGLNDYEAVPGLAALATDARRPVPVRAAALDALAGFRGPSSLNARFTLAFDETAPAELVARVLPPLGRLGALPPGDLAGFLDRSDPAVRVAALMTLGAMQSVPPGVAERLAARLDDPAPEVRKAAIAAIAGQKIAEAVPRLLELTQDESTRTEATLGLCALRDSRALPAYLNAIRDRNPDLRRAGESALTAIRDEVGLELEAQARSGKYTGAAALALERALTRFKPVVDWKVIGPFARTTPAVFLAEPSIDFGRIHVGAGDQPIAWTPAQGDAATGRVVIDDFKAGAGDRGGFGYDVNGSPDLAAFAFAEIASDADRPSLLLIGSSGTILVTLNERVVFNYANFAGRPYAADSDMVPVRLKAGRNRVLIKSRQGIGVWSFSVQVSEPSAAALAARAPGFDLEAYRAFALEHDGDARRGEAIFFDPKGIGCVKCHAAAGLGHATVGPELTGLALKYDRAELIRSVLEPAARIATGYQPVLVSTTAGQVLTGQIRAETDAQLDLIDADARVTRIPKAEIAERRVGTVSLMPTGLVEPLSTQEFADLIAYLQSLKSAPAPPPH